MKKYDIRSRQWYIGIDPGYRRTGIVLRDGAGESRQADIAAATFSQCSAGEPCGLRAVSLADSIAGRLQDWIREFQIHSVTITIEVPIYSRRKSNIATLIKQARLLQAIEEAIMCLVEPLLVDLQLYEVNPKVSKHSATGSGSATKKEIVEASPFSFDDGTVEDIEAIADAWAHSLCGDEIRGTRVPLDKMPRTEKHYVG